MKIAQISFIAVQMETTLVEFLEIVTDMHKDCSFKSISKVSLLGISSDKACEPIVCDTHSRDNTSLATELQAALIED